MTKLFRDVIDRVRQWPDERQDQAAMLLLDLEAQQTSTIRLTPEQVRETEHIQQKLRDGAASFASDEEMSAFWNQCSR
jgi:hypothetical protein